MTMAGLRSLGWLLLFV